MIGILPFLRDLWLSFLPFAAGPAVIPYRMLYRHKLVFVDDRPFRQFPDGEDGAFMEFVEQYQPVLVKIANRSETGKTIRRSNLELPAIRYAESFIALQVEDGDSVSGFPHISV